jgi:hypothetical protein
MKKVVLIMSILMNLLCNAQEDKTVTLTVSGTGQSLEEAKNNALRSAIEQAFGAFISSKTEVLNDNLVKDEIISVSNGNIQNFNVVSEVQLPNGQFSTSLKATVSVTKLTSFVESKGVLVEFKGSLFAFNINQQTLNEKNELKAVNDLIITLKSIMEKSLDFTIEAEIPKALDDTNESWNVPLNVNISFNSNITVFKKYLVETLVGISLTKSEAENYISLGKEVYELNFEKKKIILRKKESQQLILTDLFFHFVKYTLSTKISDNLSSSPISSLSPEITSSFNPIGFVTNSTNFSRMIKPQSIFDVTTYFERWHTNFNYGKVPLEEMKSYAGGYYFLNVVSLSFCDKCQFAQIKLETNKKLEEINKITEYKISKE